MDATETQEAIVFGYSSERVDLRRSRPPCRSGRRRPSPGPRTPSFRGMRQQRGRSNAEPGRTDRKGGRSTTADYWETDFPDFCAFFSEQAHSRAAFDQAAGGRPGLGLKGRVARSSRHAMSAPYAGQYALDEAMPIAGSPARCLIVHGRKDPIAPSRRPTKVAESPGASCHLRRGGACAHARFPARFNALMRDFLHRALEPSSPAPRERSGRSRRPKRALYSRPHRPGARPPRPGGHARTAQAAPRPRRSTGWRRTR